MYLCGPGKHNCQPFCGPEGRFYCSDSVCSLWPAPFSYLCVSVRILGVLKTVCGWTSKNWLLPYACCGLHFIDSAACVLSFDHSTPLHKLYQRYIDFILLITWWCCLQNCACVRACVRACVCVCVCVCVTFMCLTVRPVRQGGRERYIYRYTHHQDDSWVGSDGAAYQPNALPLVSK